MTLRIITDFIDLFLNIREVKKLHRKLEKNLFYKLHGNKTCIRSSRLWKRFSRRGLDLVEWLERLTANA